MQTTWELQIKDKAAAAAKRIKREVRELTAALRELKEASGLSDKALKSFGGGDTSRRLRAQTGLIREQTRAAKESRAAQAQSAARGRREMAQQMSAHRAVARVQRQQAAESGRARARAAGGRTRMDVPDLGGRTRAEGPTVGEFQQRARELQANRRLRDGRVAERDRVRRERLDARAAAQSNRANQGYFQRLSRLRQQSFRENDRIRAAEQRAGARATARNAAAEQRRRRTVDRDWSRARSGLLGSVGGGIRGAASAAMEISQITIGILGTMAAMVGAFGGLSLAIGAAILRMISFREATLLTLATLARAPGEDAMTPAARMAARRQVAAEQFYWAQDFARQTPLDMAEVVGLQRQVATAGYQGAAGREMLQSAADVGALRQDDPTAASRYILQMGQLERSSRARASDYRPAAQAAGVNEGAALRRAAAAAGIRQRRGEADPAYQRRVDEAQGRGAITGRQMAQAIREEQRSMLGGNAGDFARSQNGSMAAVLSNLAGGAEAFVTSIHDIENLPGILLLKQMLKDVGDMLAGATNNGKRLQAFFATFVNGSAGQIGKIFGKRGFDGMLSDAIDLAGELLPIVRGIADGFGTGFMESFGPFMEEMSAGAAEFRASGGHDLIQWAREFGRGLGVISVFMLRVTAATATLVAQGVAGMSTLSDLVGSLQELLRQFAALRRQARVAVDPFGAARDRARDAILPPGTTRRTITDALGITNRTEDIDAFEGIGAEMGRGVAAGFRSQQAFMQSEISSVMASLPAQARTDMQIKSPSRVMAEIGGYMAEGVAVGLDSGAGGVQSAMSSLVAPPGLPGFGAGSFGGMGGGAPVSVGPFYVQIDGAQGAEGVVAEFQARAEEIFAGIFERAQLVGGA